MLEFERKIAGFFEQECHLGAADKVLLAVSGGADSMALLHVVCALKNEGVLNAKLYCAHINHQLRVRDADSDEDFVRGQAQALGLPITTRRIDVRKFAGEEKLSIETAGRQLRMRSLIDIARNNNCGWIATGHHADDNAETVIQRLGRGTGFRGLGGIWPVRTFENEFNFVRALLFVRRDEIIDYLKSKGLKWRVDKTNTDYRYRRNYIRHKLIPYLQQQFNGSLVEQLSKLSESARRFDNLVSQSAEDVWLRLADISEEQLKLDIKLLLEQPQFVQVELVRKGLKVLGSGERNLTQGHFEKILELAEQNISGRTVELPGGFIVWREYENLFISKGDPVSRSTDRCDEQAVLQVPGCTQLGRYKIEAIILERDSDDIEKFKGDKRDFVEWFDLDKVGSELRARFRRTGDKFRPIGLDGEKRVGKFLTSAKVPQQVRRSVLIIEDGRGIIWVCPVRMSESVKVTSETRKILQLKVSSLSN